MQNSEDHQSDSLADFKQLGLFAAIASLGYVFWVVGAMEMIERLAYYGVKAVAAIYATDAKSDGGLGVTPGDFGVLLFLWALVQSLLPAFTGGLSDRFGYKETIFASTVIKIVGYLVMAAMPFYWGFYLGAVILAAGTAVFKPGIQATLVKSTNRRNSSMAWGIFYQTVNIGGYLGPIVAAYMRSNFSWQMVFIVCAIIISCNFLLLLTYREVGKEERLEAARIRKEKGLRQESLFVDSLKELSKPHVYCLLIVFSGFFFMFNSLFDVLPLHINEWVDRGDIMNSLFGGQSNNEIVRFFFGMNEDGTNINPEGLQNLNSFMIMLTCFLFAYLSGLMKATTSMVVGTLFSSIALIACGHSTTGWIMAFCIALFSVGEMLSSPKFLEFVGNFAPRKKKAMYLGFSQIPTAVGWTLEAYIGPAMYGRYASKDKFSRELLAERLKAGEAALPTASSLESVQSDTVDVEGSQTSDSASAETVEQLAERIDGKSAEEITALAEQSPDEFVEIIPQGEAFDWLVTMTGESPKALTELLYNTHNIALVWYIMGGVGIISAIGTLIYARWIGALIRDDSTTIASE